MNVMVLSPILDGMKGKTVGCLSRLLIHSMKNGIEVDFRETTGSRLLDNVRNELVDYALKNAEVTHLLFVDADMTFPPDTLHRMLSHEADVCGVAYVARASHPVAYLFDGFDDSGQLKLNVTKILHPNGDKSLEVEALAGGILLIKREVFGKIEKPYFKMQDELVGEDIYFSRKVFKAGLKQVCDLALSEEVGHISEEVRTLGLFRGWAGTPTGKKFLEMNAGLTA